MNSTVFNLSATRLQMSGFILLWFSAVIVAAQTGALARIPLPAIALLVALGITIPTMAYFLLSPIRHVIDAIGIHRLTLLHVWRIPAALLFFYYGVRDELPTLFWVLAGVGDFLAGSFAATMLWRARSPVNYRRIHLFGFADFVAAVGTGLTFTLLQEPKMALLTTLPMALIPLFGVGLSGASHIVAFNMLARERKIS